MTTQSRRFVPVDEITEETVSQRMRELLGLLVIVAGLYALLSLATFREGPLDGDIPRQGMVNLGGVVGYHVASGLLFVLGLAAYIPFLFMVGYGLLMFLGRISDRMTTRAVGVVVFTALMAILFTSPTDSQSGALFPEGPGGRFGAVLSPRLLDAFGGAGRLLLLLVGVVLSFFLATEFVLSVALQRGAEGSMLVGNRLKTMLPKRGAKAAADDEEAAEDGEYAEDEYAEDEEVDGEEEWEYEDEDEEEEESAAESAGKKGQKAKAAKTKAEKAKAAKAQKARAAKLKADQAKADKAKAKEAKAKAKAEAKAAKPKKPAKEAKEAKEVPVVVLRPQPKKPPEQQSLPFDAVYPYPPVDLFQEVISEDTSASASLIQTNSQAIERRLSSFKIAAKVVSVSAGPAVTQYEIRLPEGIKVSRIPTFEPDLAAALKAVTVRVVAPIPGKDTVGIEVPNGKRQMVVLRELLDQFGRNLDDMAIPLFLGKDVTGAPIVEDLARMPHLLIAGTTGSGKSVCINTILLSILMTRPPARVQLILIDPKMVELQSYKSVPHLASPVVTSMKKAPSVLNWAVEEMDRRYALLSAVRCNHIRSFNRLDPVEVEKRLGREPQANEREMPYMVLVIDELADLMAVAAKEVEESIQRLAQKSRAVGLHVILATQRPSTDVITGVIKANLPCQIAFKVSRKVDSRVILDSNGAEKLLGHGDMLYVAPGSHQTVRAQGTYVSEGEIHRVVDYLDEQGQRPHFIPGLMEQRETGRRDPKDRDALYAEAVEVVLGQQRGSATLLQRSLSVGYTRATRLLELMEQDGLVGPFVGSKSRELMMTLDEWKQREEAIAEELDGASVSTGGETVESEDDSSNL